MKKILPIGALLLFFLQAQAQITPTIDLETGQPILADCGPVNKAAPAPSAKKSALLAVSLSDVYAHNAGLDSADRELVKEFVKTCRPFLDKFYAIYFFLGGNENAHKLNFLNPDDNDFAFTLRFPNGATHNENGTFFDGSASQYANTQMMPALMKDANVGASYYLRDNVPGGAIISNGTGSFSIWRRDSDGNAYGYIAGAASGVPVPDYRGFGTIQREGANLEVFNAGELAGNVNSPEAGNFSSELPIKLSQNYSIPQGNSLTWEFAAIHQALSKDEEEILFNAVEIMQVKKNRNVSPL